MDCVDGKTYPANVKFVNNAKAYAGQSNGTINYDKLWTLKDMDVDTKEKEVRFSMEKEYETKAAILPPPIAP